MTNDLATAGVDPILPVLCYFPAVGAEDGSKLFVSETVWFVNMVKNRQDIQAGKLAGPTDRG